MRENLLKRKLSNGGAAFGAMSTSSDPMLAEMAGYLGFDFFIMDGEHGALAPADALNMVRTCEAVGITPMARIRTLDTKLILQYLDAGVMGVQMPSIKSVDEVKRLVDAVRYPPVGKRGMGPIRAAEYLIGSMSQGDYVAMANEEILLFPQLEDIEAIDCLDDLVRVEGIDGFILGPRDLAMSMGFYDGPDHPEVKAAIDKAYRVVVDAGLVLGGSGGSGEATRAEVARGLRLSITSFNYLISTAAASFLRAARG